jgi:adenosylcobinamide-GDP ribazoletransferase
MQHQWLLLRTAIMFYTRIPVGRNMGHGLDLLNNATRYLPFIGWITGGAMALVLWGASQIAPWTISILFSLIAAIWITGAFHEDGFADMCDGFGGGWTKEKILLIMKDSRIGTFGMLGLVLLMLLKFYALQSLSLEQALLAIIIAQPLSRFVAVTIIYTLPYVRENEDSKAKPVSKGISGWELTLAGCFGLLPLIVIIIVFQHYILIFLLPVLWLVRAYMSRKMRRWIGGYTGDCLGAIQQVSETVVYLFLCIAAWIYT